jgi:hypothetical protein
MRKKRAHAKTDPELLRQLKSAAARNKPVQAVFTLRSPRKSAASPGRVEKLTHKILDRAAESAGVSAREVNVFRNLGAFAVYAVPSFIRELLNDPDIAYATANLQSEKMLIQPRKKKPLG